MLSLTSTGLAILASLFRLAFADCECGYATEINGSRYAFTDLIETDFAHLSDVTTNTDWVRQTFNLSREASRGSVGEMFAPENMHTNPASDMRVEYGQADNGQAAGLDLVVKADLVDAMVPVAEIDTARADIVYGTFRAGLKLTGVPGTCSAFFWYFNDTQEIDMEFLSKDYNATSNSYPINLVLQSRRAAEQGFNAQGTGSFAKAYLPFDPTAAFHEYRVDFLPGTVRFYADSQLLAQMNGRAVPAHAGHLVLRHWSNGNRYWSGGPPGQDAVTTVAYVKAYFNSSSPQRQQDWSGRCHDDAGGGSSAKAICSIPEVTATDSTAAGWFFSNQRNMTNNQTISGKSSASERQAPRIVALSLFVVVSVTFGWTLGT